MRLLRSNLCSELLKCAKYYTNTDADNSCENNDIHIHMLKHWHNTHIIKHQRAILASNINMEMIFRNTQQAGKNYLKFVIN